MTGFIHTGLYLLSTFPAFSHRPISGLLDTCTTQGPPVSSSGPVGHLSLENWVYLSPSLLISSFTSPKAYTTLLISLSTAAHSCRTRFLNFILCFSHFLVLGLKGRYFTEMFMITAQPGCENRNQHENRLSNTQRLASGCSQVGSGLSSMGTLLAAFEVQRPHRLHDAQWELCSKGALPTGTVIVGRRPWRSTQQWSMICKRHSGKQLCFILWAITYLIISTS